MLRAILLIVSVIPIFSGLAMGLEAPRLEINLESADYLLGEPVVLRVEITNQGSGPITFLADPAGWGPYWRVTVRDETGRQLPYQGLLSLWPPPGKSTAYQLAIGQSRVFDYDLSENFDLSVAGQYTAALSYDASRELSLLRAGNFEVFAQISAVASNGAAANFRIVPPAGADVEALVQLFSTRRGGREFDPCCLGVAHLQKILSDHPTSFYTPYARFWLARSLSPGLVHARLQHYELVRNTASRRWLRAAAQYEMARIYERLNRPADAIAAYKTLRADFPDSPISQKAEDRIRAMGAVLAKPQK